MEAQPLLADIGDVIGVIITLAIIGFSIISKILGAANEGKRPPPRPPQGPRPPQQPPVRARPVGGGPVAKSIESEIEDFLRQARGGQQAPQRPPVEPMVQPRTIVEATPVVDEVVPGRNFGRDLAEHVQQHIARDSISQRDARLGQTIESTDERYEQHLEGAFDHDVGHLAHVEAVDTSVAEGTDSVSWDEKKKQDPAETAVRIMNLLKSPSGIRDVFIAAEILKRPEI